MLTPILSRCVLTVLAKLVRTTVSVARIGGGGEQEVPCSTPLIIFNNQSESDTNRFGMGN